MVPTLYCQEEIEYVLSSSRVILESIRSNYARSTIVLFVVCILVTCVRWLHEISWTLVLAPLVMSMICLALSACVNIYHSENFRAFLSTVIPFIQKAIPPSVSSQCTSSAFFIWWRLRILVQTTLKRVVIPETLRNNKAFKSLFERSNYRSVIICILLLLFYTSVNMFTGDNDVHFTPATNYPTPSIAIPFIFLHVPGSGGVAFRKSLHIDAQRLRSNKFIPCFDGLKCAINTDQEFNKTFIRQQTRASQLTMTQREMRCAAIIGGHFKMSLLSVLAALDGVDDVDACPSRHWELSPYRAPQFNVVIILRHPIHRIISHYYRFGRTGPNKDKSFADLSTSELQTFLLTTGEKLVVSYLTSSKITDFDTIADATKNAMKNLRLCTVGVFEYWEETTQVLRRKNPWLHPPTYQVVERSRELPASLHPEVIGLLINRLVAEMRVYEYALNQFKAEVSATPSLVNSKLKLDPLFSPSHENYYR